MALPSRPQDHGPLVLGDTPPAALLPRKALLPDLVRLLPRSRRRGLERCWRTTSANHSKPKEQFMYLNRVTLIGFTGQQPKTLATRTGKELTRLSVATTRRYQQDSEWKEKTQGHDCVLYGATAHVAATLPKGSHVLIEGGTHLPGVRAECRIRDGRYQSALASNRDCCRIDQNS